ncbi:MAG: porin [Gemmatimonadaceae bacterium]|nr:porin [Chitinophagaceae bacterium]
MLRKFMMASAAMGVFVVAQAQDASVPATPATVQPATDPIPEKAPLLVISGSADAYFRYDFAKTKGNNYTSFTGTHNTFAIGMASVKVEHKGEKVGGVLDLGFGPRAKEFSYNDDGITQAIKQLYVYYAPTDWLKFSAGTWATHVGYELVDPQLNRNYSMSYMFTNGPFTHTGLKAEITKGKHGVMVGVSNATDYRIIPDGQINRKFFLAQYSFAPTDKVKFYLNYVGGEAPDTSKSSQFDLVATAKITDKFNVGFNGTINSTKLWDGSKNISAKNWGGAAVYLNVDPTPAFGLTLRGEYFSDKDQLKVYSSSPVGGTVFATTLSANFRVGGLLIIPEFRFDSGSENLFVDKDGASKSSFGSFLVAAVYSF